MSFGDKPTYVDMDQPGMTLLMGTNGEGKSSVMDALAFCLTGKPVRKISPGKLVNNFNGKGMIVKCYLTLRHSEVLIIRGQKPGICKLYQAPANTSDKDIESDKFDLTRDSIQNTSDFISELLGFDSELFRCMIVSSTRTPTFFQADSSLQKRITESLFGFDSLTSRAAEIAIERKAMEEDLRVERARNDEKESSLNRIKEEVESLEAQSASWHRNKDSRIESARELCVLDVDWDQEANKATQLQNHLLEEEELEKSLKDASKSKSDKEIAKKDLESKIKDLNSPVPDLSDVRDEWADYEMVKEALADSKAEFATLHQEISALHMDSARLISELESIEGDNCPSCGQSWPDVNARKTKRRDLEAKLELTESELSNKNSSKDELSNTIEEMKLVTIPEVSLEELARHEERKSRREDDLNQLQKNLADVECSLEVVTSLISEITESISKHRKNAPPGSKFGTLSEIKVAEANAISAAKSLEKITQEEDPYLESLFRLRSESSKKVDRSNEQKLESGVESRKFLEKSLTRKDSPIRRAVMSRFLPVLNSSLADYLERTGLPYTVTFQDDLSPLIMDYDSEVDPMGLSGGQEERLVMSLNWAFRDCWEQIHATRIQFGGIDERLDSGLDSEGQDMCMELLHQEASDGRSVWVVTHREDFIDYSSRVMRVSRNGRFSQINLDQERSEN